MLKKLNSKGFGTKNLPDAIQWHFAKYWTHMLKEIGLTKDQLNEKLKKSSDQLESSVAFPIMLKTSEKKMNSQSKIIKKIIESL